jgi:hypothetical protein
MLNSQTPRADTPIFVRVGDHGNAFERYHADGRPWPLALDQKGGLFDGALPAPNLDPAKAAAIGARKQQMDQGDAGAIPRQLASELHDLSFKAGTNEADHAAFTRVLSALCESSPAPGAMEKAAAADKGGSGRISRSTAHKAWTLARDKLSPGDLAEFTKLLRGMVDESLPNDYGDEDEEAPNDVGTMAGDEKARAATAREFGLDRIGVCPKYGEPMPRTRRERQARLALDAAKGGAGDSGYLANDKATDEAIRKILK